MLKYLAYYKEIIAIVSMMLGGTVWFVSFIEERDALQGRTENALQALVDRVEDLQKRHSSLEKNQTKWETELAELQDTTSKLQMALSKLPEDTSAAIEKIAQAEQDLRVLNIRGSKLELSDDLKEELEGLGDTYRLVSDLQEQLNEIRSVASNADEKLHRMTALIMDDPEKVLSLIVLRQELEGMQVQLSAVNTRIVGQEGALAGRIGTLQWVIGTVFIALLAVVAQVFLPQLKRQ